MLNFNPDFHLKYLGNQRGTVLLTYVSRNRMLLSLLLIMQIYEHETITAAGKITCVVTWKRHRVIRGHMQDTCRLKDGNDEMLLGLLEAALKD